MQTSIMLKFRPSTVEGKTGSLYLQLIKNRKSRVSVFKGCKIYPNEWDAANESFRLNTGNPQRKIYLENLYAKVTDMKSKIEAIAWEFENLSPGYTLDDLVESFQVKKKGNTLSSFIESEACKLENLHPRTARSYRSVMRKIKQYCPDKDLLLGEITSEFIFRFEQYMRNTGNKLTTTSY